MLVGSVVAASWELRGPRYSKGAVGVDSGAQSDVVFLVVALDAGRPRFRLLSSIAARRR